MFVNREPELAFLNSLLIKERPTAAQLVLLYGRRRVGKTVLARHWAETTGLPTLYWAAEREPANFQRRKLYAKMLGVSLSQSPLFESWADVWSAYADLVGDQRQILILDEIPYPAESDPAFLSALQHAWDQRLKQSRLIIILSGSHIHTMETLLAQGSPLFGRFTGQWHLLPLEFNALKHFLPKWTLEERIAAYAMLGGVPAYLEQLLPDRSLTDNIRDVILAPGGLFVAEPELLLYDEVRDPRVYHAILQALGAGAHTLDEIAQIALIAKPHLSLYLNRLQELHFVERRLPVTVWPAKLKTSRMGRYHFVDPFLRFYFRFIAPQRADVSFRREEVLTSIREQLRSFVGATAYEELCREWLTRASRSRQLPFEVSSVGSHWNRDVQVDVVGVNWRERAVVIGECKWGSDPVARDVLRDLIEQKTPKLLKALPDEGAEWRVQQVLFSRAGFTPATRVLAEAQSALLIDIEQLARGLG